MKHDVDESHRFKLDFIIDLLVICLSLLLQYYDWSLICKTHRKY